MIAMTLMREPEMYSVSGYRFILSQKWSYLSIVCTFMGTHLLNIDAESDYSVTTYILLK